MFYAEMNQDRVDMKRMQEEIHQTYGGTHPDGLLAPYGTLFSLLEKHRLQRLADQFMKARDREWHRHDEDVMELKVYDENGNHKYSTAMLHLRPGRKFLAGPGCKPILLNQCACCKNIKEGIEAEYCGLKHCAPILSTCRACTRYRTCSICGRESCVCRFVKCCVEDCPNLMCRCQLLDLQDNEEYGVGCAFVLDPDDDDSDSSAEQMKYCQEHKPDGCAL
jgi:hypothetical protein